MKNQINSDFIGDLFISETTTQKTGIIGNYIYEFDECRNGIVRIAGIIHEQKIVYPMHGYFFPHKLSRISLDIASELRYKFNNK